MLDFEHRNFYRFIEFDSEAGELDRHIYQFSMVDPWVQLFLISACDGEEENPVNVVAAGVDEINAYLEDEPHEIASPEFAWQGEYSTSSHDVTRDFYLAYGLLASMGDKVYPTSMTMDGVAAALTTVVGCNQVSAQAVAMAAWHTNRAMWKKSSGEGLLEASVNVDPVFAVKFAEFEQFSRQLSFPLKNGRKIEVLNLDLVCPNMKAPFYGAKSAKR